MNQAIYARIGAQPPTGKAPRDYLVTVFKALKSGDLYALALRVTVDQTIEWVRSHVDEIAAIGVQNDPVARKVTLPIVALNVESA